MFAHIALGVQLLIQPASAPSPYIGEELRPIKSLSQEQIEGLLNARGMGLARAAELNGYPGPMHVLQLKDQLELTPQQLGQAQRAFDEMKARATELGRAIVDDERRLDDAFARGAIDDRSLDGQVSQIAKLNGELRATHLRAHLRMREILTPQQIEKYDDLRGYRKRDK